MNGVNFLTKTMDHLKKILIFIIQILYKINTLNVHECGTNAGLFKMGDVDLRSGIIPDNL